MTIVDELRILGRLNFLQLTVILLVGLMLWWIVSETIESGAESLLISLLDPDDETTYYWVIRSIVSSIVNPIASVLGVFAGLWAGYGTFCLYKKKLLATDAKDDSLSASKRY